MPFHVGGRKPKYVLPEKRSGLVWQRLGFICLGMFLIFVGIKRQSEGILAAANHYGMPIYSATLISLGVVFVVVAITPPRLLERLVAWLISKT